MKKKLILVMSGVFSLVGCASSIDTVMFSNAAKVHIFTPQEQSEMTPEGTIQTMITPSELREYFKNAAKVTKPTGVVNYCGSGLPSLVKSRRNVATLAIDEVCGGKDNYTIRREGLGNVAVRQIGSLQVGASCVRPMSIYFRCNGIQPKP